MGNIRRLLFCALACAAGLGAASPRPEISWSIMHPTAIDVDYMRRVVEKAREYGGVDSFEVCGDCHGGASGINGLSLLARYPHAHAHVDARMPITGKNRMAAVEKLLFHGCQCFMTRDLKGPVSGWSD